MMNTTSDTDDKELNFSEKLLVNDIVDPAEMCKSKCGSKYLSALVYMSLHSFKIKWEDIDEYLKRIGFMTAQTSHKWATVFINGDYEEFSSDLRGGKHIDSFYDMFLEIETDAKAFVVEACSRKSADFKASYLAQFIDTKYYEVTGSEKQGGDDLITSESSCRLNLRRWRAKFEANSQHFYYTITDGETPTWKMPTQKPNRILICKWSNRSFKGRGRRHMVSDFLVQHPSGPFFELNENEWKHAVLKYKSLNADCDVNYVDRTTTASINMGTDAYFYNDTILGQFERLFQMLEFKQDYKYNQVEIIVDNARTHTTEAYSLQDFGKSIGTRCPVEQIEYVDENGKIQIIDCYFKEGNNKGRSKGLVELCKDLGVQLPAKIKLNY
ncbi:unnamed protein product [Rotaria sp. Silwood2]|nr:unnamed protein product [Rotaria sp. Silwood2]CAF3381104.1 unnamed protein product [Rotaria sp. Silwood2]CAF4576621.1 unnamed protein product [Rotaria sp. Silwood2]